MAAPSVSAVETDGVVPIDVEVILMGGSEIDLVIPLFTKSGSSTLDHSTLGIYIIIADSSAEKSCISFTLALCRNSHTLLIVLYGITSGDGKSHPAHLCSCNVTFFFFSSVLNAATSDVDYDSNVNSVTLEAAMIRGTVTLTTNVTLIDDAVLEFEEQFTVFLNQSVSPSAIVIDSSANTTTFFLGDDGMLTQTTYKCT